MTEYMERTRLLLGQEGLDRLRRSKAVVFGAGGVGSYAIEALARAGVGHLVLVDHDIFCASNINRQIGALHSTLGRRKVEVMRDRILDINPAAKVTIYPEYVDESNVARFLDESVTYIVDAIDSVGAKLAIIEKGLSMKIPVISALGAGNRLDPTRLAIADISKTSGCALARAVRTGLRKRGISSGVKVVYSTEPPKKQTGKLIGSVSFVPPVAGLYLAAQVVNDICSTWDAP